MSDAWSKAVEQISLLALIQGARVLGFTSVGSESGVTALSRAVAELLALSDVKVLLADLAQPVSHARLSANGEPRETELWHRVRQDERGFDVKSGQISPYSKFLFNDNLRLGRELSKDLLHYSVIILDLPPLLLDQSDRINPVAGATCCDAVLLVCSRGKVQGADIRTGQFILESARVNLVGTVMNNFGYRTPGEEIAGIVQRFAGFAPRLVGRIRHKVLGSELFG